jgi:hypothetical protein
MARPARLASTIALASLLVASLLAACGGSGGPTPKPTEPPKATLPPDLKVASCIPSGPFVTAHCEDPIETIFAQVGGAANFTEVRVTVTGSEDCAMPRQLAEKTPKPEKYFWMVRFTDGQQDWGGFVGQGGVLGKVCKPFTSQ